MHVVCDTIVQHAGWTLEQLDNIFRNEYHHSFDPAHARVHVFEPEGIHALAVAYVLALY